MKKRVNTVSARDQVLENAVTFHAGLIESDGWKYLEIETDGWKYLEKELPGRWLGDQ
jgi:hypothetical protein